MESMLTLESQSGVSIDSMFSIALVPTGINNANSGGKTWEEKDFTGKNTKQQQLKSYLPYNVYMYVYMTVCILGILGIQSGKWATKPRLYTQAENKVQESNM